MKYLSLAYILSIALSASAQPTLRMDYWQLVWEDNFDFIDETKWVVENNFDHWGGEPQVYTNRPENVFIENGNLVLRVNREEYTCPPEAVNPWRCVRQYNTGQPYQYTSGWIETRQPDYNTQYGLIEARIQLPYGYGFWPAFWTFIADDPPGASNAGEIDIFEMLGHKPSNKITTNIHLEYCNENQPDYPVCAAIPDYYQENLIADYAYTYHSYGIEWSPTQLKWWIDDYLFRWDPNPGVVDPVRLILNMAIEPWALPNASTPFPSDYKIDHVRVYSLVTSAEDQIISEEDLTLFPNPVDHSGEVWIHTRSGLSIRQAELFNSLGEQMAINWIGGQDYIRMDISQLDAGMYFLNFHTDHGSATRRLFIP